MDIFDWLSIKQDHPNASIPPKSEWKLPEGCIASGYIKFDESTSDLIKQGSSPIEFEGSFSTKISLHVSGTTIKLDGNVGRFNRLDNLFGITSLDALVEAANDILKSIHPDLPLFTKATKKWQRASKGTKDPSFCSNGAYLLRLDICRNTSYGQGNVEALIRSHSMLPFRYMRPHLYENGKTVAWCSPNKTADDMKASSRLYPKIYCKAHDLLTKALPQAIKDNPPIKDLDGTIEDTKEVKYIKDLILFCEEQGIARHEISFKYRFLDENHYRFYGLFDEKDLKSHVQQFVDLDKKAGGNAMSYETLQEKLVSSGACKSLRQASTTMGYYSKWRLGHPFEGSEATFKRHRSALNKVGIDIAIKYDQSKVTDIFVKESREIIRRPTQIPSFYVNHHSMQLRAVS